MTKIRFTKASNRDSKNVVTVRLNRDSATKQGEDFLFLIKAKRSNKIYQVKFVCNRRDGTTAKTTEWPERFTRPEVGFPVEYEVVDVL